jgi:nitroimidazol reductase NimA-like FMN-containing flavoprotein (pyridoxamine 5'-phosphate oxidase superfamily)
VDRTFDRSGLEVLSEEECWRFLESHHIGRLAVAIAGEPEVFPVNYVVDDRTIVFLTAEGTKLAAALLGRAVAMEIDAADPMFHTGWSVVVRAHAHEIERLDDLMAAQDLPLRPWGPGDKRRYVRLVPTAVTGRRIVAPGGSGRATA